MTRRAFTLIEILCCVLVLGTGLAAVIGMFTYSNRLAAQTIAESTAWITARSVALRDPSGTAVLDWNGSQGYVNGYWVTKQTITTDSITGGLKRVTIRADVFDAQSGEQLASETTSRIEMP